MKICKECQNEFIQKSNKGSEQLFCSPRCRNKNTYKRREANLRQKLQNEIGKIHSDKERSEAGVLPEPQGAPRGFTTFPEHVGGDKIFTLIMENATMTAENKRLTDKVQALEIEKGQLLADIEGLEQENDRIAGDDIGSMVKPLIPAIAPLIVGWLTPKEDKSK